MAHSGAHQPKAGHVALAALERQPDPEQNGQREESERRISLHGMQRNAERRAAPDCSQRVRVSDSPAHAGRGIGAVTRAGGQRAQLLEGQARQRAAGPAHRRWRGREVCCGARTMRRSRRRRVRPHRPAADDAPSPSPAARRDDCGGRSSWPRPEAAALRPARQTGSGCKDSTPCRRPRPRCAPCAAPAQAPRARRVR